MATKKPLTANYFKKNCPSIQKSVSATTTTTKKGLKTAFLYDAGNFSHSAITIKSFDEYIYNFEKKYEYIFRWTNVWSERSFAANLVFVFVQLATTHGRNDSSVVITSEKTDAESWTRLAMY
jgi:hypothetical protein